MILAARTLVIAAPVRWIEQERVGLLGLRLFGLFCHCQYGIERAAVEAAPQRERAAHATSLLAEDTPDVIHSHQCADVGRHGVEAAKGDDPCSSLRCLSVETLD